MEYDVLVIGGGHNGLVSACYLAKAGLRVAIIEKSAKVGGLCNSEEILPKHFVSVGADVFGMLRPKIAKDLELEKYGLEAYPMDPQLFMPFPDGSSIALWRSLEKTLLEIKKFSNRDAEQFVKFSKFTEDAADVIDEYLLTPPPSWDTFETAFRAKGIPEALQWMLNGTIAQLLDNYFESPQVKAALMLGAIFFRSAGPKQLGTVMAHFVTANHYVGNEKNTTGYVRGGMGQIAMSLKSVAKRLGVDIFTNMEVNKIIVEEGHVRGINTNNEKSFHADNIVSCVDIKKTFLKLIDPQNIPVSSFSDQVKELDVSGNHTRIIAVVNALPRFSCMSGKDDTASHSGYIAIAPSIEYADRAWKMSEKGSFSEEPIIGISIQSVTDSSVTSDDHHVMAIYVLFTPYNPDLSKLSQLRQQITSMTFDRIEEYAPGFKESIIKYKTYTPMDLELEYGATEGGCDQVTMSVNQMFSSRPLPDWSNYHTPIKGLFLGGSATHPGGGVSGASGYNSAQAVITSLGIPPVGHVARE